MARTDLREVRDLLAAALTEFGNSGLSSREIIQKFRKTHAREVSLCADALIDTALVKILVDASSRRPRASLVPNQGDLFAGFSVPTAVAIPVPGAKAKQRKAFSNLTFEELNSWFKDHNRTRSANVKQLAEIRRLINRIKPHMTSGDMTIAEGLLAAERAEAERAEEHQKS